MAFVYYAFEIDGDLCSTSQDDKDNSRDSLIARRLESYLNEIYVSSIPSWAVLSGAINDSRAGPINN